MAGREIDSGDFLFWEVFIEVPQADR